MSHGRLVRHRGARWRWSHPVLGLILASCLPWNEAAAQCASAAVNNSFPCANASEMCDEGQALAAAEAQCAANLEVVLSLCPSQSAYCGSTCAFSNPTNSPLRWTWRVNRAGPTEVCGGTRLYTNLCEDRPAYEPAGDPENFPESFCADGCEYATRLRGGGQPGVNFQAWLEAYPTGQSCFGGDDQEEQQPPRDDPPCVETPNGLVCFGEDGPCAESEAGVHCVNWEDAPACEGPFCVGPPDDQEPPENPPPEPNEPYGEEPPESGTAKNQPPPPGVDPPCTGSQACFWNWDFHPEPEGGGGGPGGGEPCVGEDCPEPCVGEDCEPCTGEDCGSGPGGPGGGGVDPCVGDDCPEPCVGDDCPEPCVGDDCEPCVGDDCEPCVGEDCEPCVGDDCEGGGQAGGGATCGAAPTCSGDAVGCAILRQAWETRCAVERLGQGGDDEDAPVLNDNPQDHSGTVAIGTGMLDTGGFAGGGGSCPEWGPLEILGHSFTLPQPHCNLILWFGYLLVASATFVAGRIIAGG